jgi:hypothetical protein
MIVLHNDVVLKQVTDEHVHVILMIIHIDYVAEYLKRLNVIIELGVILHIPISIVMIDVRNLGDDGLEMRIP